MLMTLGVFAAGALFGILIMSCLQMVEGDAVSEDQLREAFRREQNDRFVE